MVTIVHHHRQSKSLTLFAVVFHLLPWGQGCTPCSFVSPCREGNVFCSLPSPPFAEPPELGSHHHPPPCRVVAEAPSSHRILVIVVVFEFFQRVFISISSHRGRTATGVGAMASGGPFGLDEASIRDENGHGTGDSPTRVVDDDEVAMRALSVGTTEHRTTNGGSIEHLDLILNPILASLLLGCGFRGDNHHACRNPETIAGVRVGAGDWRAAGGNQRAWFDDLGDRSFNFQ